MFTLVHPGCRLVHSGWHSDTSLGSLGSLGSALGVVGFILGCCVHSVAPWVSLDSYGVVWFTPVRPGGLWVHPGSFGRALGGSCGLLGSSEVVGFTLERPGGDWVHPGSLGSLGCTLGVVGFIKGVSRVRARGRWVHPGSLGALDFIRSRWIHLMRPGGCWVHPVSLS